VFEYAAGILKVIADYDEMLFINSQCPDTVGWVTGRAGIQPVKSWPLVCWW